MPEATHEVVLHGCTPEPLMHYLKALGILRLVAEDREHGDPRARGFWRDDVFVLRSRLDESALEAFFLEHYKPTPIVAPWGARSGFFEGSSEKAAREALLAIEKSEMTRLAVYRSAINSARQLMQNLCMTEKQADTDAKTEFLRQCRSWFPSELVAWFDTCCVLTGDDRKFPPLLGTGGNEGSGSYVSGFAQQVVQCIIEGKHREAIGNSLFANHAEVDSDQTPGHFSGRAAGGPNATQGFDGKTTTNPWDYILCLEGTCLWASAAVRRLGRSGDGVAAFPFTVRVVGAGSLSLALKDGLKPKQAKREIAELWLPLWGGQLSLGELTHLLSEGRASLGSRLAVNGTDMARAAATLGVDRGICEFARTSFLMRNGQSFLSIPLGRFEVGGNRAGADLLREIDPWLEKFRKAVATSAKKPENRVKRFVAAERSIDVAVFDFCRYGGAAHFTDILIALGVAEREMALTPGKIGQSKTKVAPLAGLSADWIRAAMGTPDGTAFDPGSTDPEFQIALALAGVRAGEGEQGKVGPLRSNLEPVSTWYDRNEQRTRAKWAERDRAVVWNAADLPANLAAVLARRVMDSGRKGCDSLPLAPASDRLAASPAAIASFLRGELDEQRVADLLWGLMLVDQRPLNAASGDQRHRAGIDGLPSIFCLLKLLFLPRDLRVSTGRNGKPHWQIVGQGERGTHRIRPEPAILALLRAGRVGEAAAIAMRRLRSSGLTPLPHRRSGGPSRDEVWREVRLSPCEGQRLAAALLIPIDPRAINALVHSVTRGDEFDLQAPVPDGSGDHDDSRAAVAASTPTNPTLET